MEYSDKKYFWVNTAIIGFLVLLFVALRLQLIQNCLHLIHDCDTAEIKHINFSDILHDKYTSALKFLSNIELYVPKSFHAGSFFPAYPVIAYSYYLCSFLTGTTYYTIKITTLIFSTLAFFFWLLLLKDNKKNLFLFAVFFLFPPLYFLKWSLTLWGGSTECLFFYPLCIYMHLKLDNSTKNICLKGFVYGFSVYFSYFCAPLIAVLFLPALIGIFEDNKKSIPLFLIMMALGFSPWLWHYNLVANDTRLTLLEPQQAVTFKENLIMNIFWGPYFEPAFSIKNISWEKTGFIFLIAQLVSLPLAYFKIREIKLKKIAIYILLMSALFLICISASSYNTIPSDLRYYVPLYPLYALALIFIATSGRYKILNIPAIIILTVFFSLNIRDNILFYRLGYPDAHKDYKLLLHAKNHVTAPIETADNLNFFLEELQFIRTPSFNAAVKAVFTEISGGRYFWPTDKHKQFLPSTEEIMINIKKQTQKLTTPKQQEDFFSGLGFGIYLKHEQNKEAMTLINKLPKQHYSTILRGYNDAIEMLQKKNKLQQ